MIGWADTSSISAVAPLSLTASNSTERDMNLMGSRASSSDGRPRRKRTSLGARFQCRSVVVAVDATEEFTLAALKFTLRNVVRPGDDLYLLGILQPTPMNLDDEDYIPIDDRNPQILKMEGEFHKAIVGDQEIQRLLQMTETIPEVRIAIGSDREVVTAEQALELRATWVILDKHLKEDGAYLMGHLNCNIVLMGSLNDLDEAAFIKIELRHAAGNSSILEWKARWKAALRTARGLCYLQDKCHVNCVVHRDMRPSNIHLTDAEPVPMGEDLGQPESPEEGDKSDDPEETTAPGKLGSRTPQYADESEKADIYSFGIVLLELISGRKANDATRTSRELSLTEWARPLIADGRTLEIVDPRLRVFCDIDQANKMAEAAGRCISKNPAERPEISEVLDILRRDTSRVGLPSRGISASDLSSFPKWSQTVNPVMIPQRGVDTTHSQANGVAARTKALVAARHYRQPVVNPRVNNILKQTPAGGKTPPLRAMSYAITGYATSKWSSRRRPFLKIVKPKPRQISYEEMIA